MKKILSFLFALLYFTAVNYSYSASATPTINPKITEKLTSTEIISDLKERIASRVAQLKLVERKGVIGEVTDISDTQITIVDKKNDTKFIDVDEITKFSSPSAKGSFGISDITKGSKIGILGLYNKQSRRILARFVDVISIPKFEYGTIASVDEDNFSLTLATEKDEIIIDVEKITRTLLYSKSSGLSKSGFSKITEETHAAIVGFPDIKNPNRLIASKIILFPEIPKNPKIVVFEKALNLKDNITPSTGSGKKIVPLTK